MFTLLVIQRTDETFANRNYIQESVSNLCPYTEFCTFNATKSIDDPKAKSCCGSCSCESDCWDQRNCCHDNSDVIHQPAQLTCKAAIVKTRPGNSVDERFEKGVQSTGYYITDSCPRTEKNKTLQEKCIREKNERIEDLLWVTDTQSGRIFQNLHCARCHGAKEWVTWDVRTMCTEILEADFVSTANVLLSSNCNIINEVPEDLEESSRKLQCTVPDYTFCNQTGLWDRYDATLEKDCNTNTIPFFQESPAIVYKNAFCFLCNKGIGDSFSTICYPTDARFKFKGFSALLDLKGTMEKSTSPLTAECDIGEIKDIYTVSKLLIEPPHGISNNVAF